MRRALWTVALLAALAPVVGRAGDTDTQKKITQLSQQIIDASIKADTAALDGLLADDCVIINPFGEVYTKAEHLKLLKDGSLHFESIKRSEVKVRVYGDSAVVTARTEAKAKLKGRKEVGTPVRITEVYANQGARWRCVSIQVTFIAEPSAGSR